MKLPGTTLLLLHTKHQYHKYAIDVLNKTCEILKGDMKCIHNHCPSPWEVTWQHGTR